MRDLMIAHRKCPACPRIQQFLSKFIAHSKQSRLSQRSVDVHGMRHLGDPIFTDDDRLDAMFEIEVDQRARDLIYGAQVISKRRLIGSEPLPVVIQMGEIDERKSRTVLRFHRSRALGDPSARLDPRSRPPEMKERESAKFCLQFVAKRCGVRPQVRDLSAIGGVHGPWRDGDVRRRIHVEPPEEIGASE